FLPHDHLQLPPSPVTLPGFDNPRIEPERSGWLLLCAAGCGASGSDELGGLTPRDLRDIGVSASDARAEIAKPFWRA
ncbi:MAG TPA: DUF1127 domain-containing protein, partial [Acetobacteraceae bacterium]